MGVPIAMDTLQSGVVFQAGILGIVGLVLLVGRYLFIKPFSHTAKSLRLPLL